MKTRRARADRIRIIPDISDGDGLSPSWSEAEMTPMTGVAKVPMPAIPAGSSLSARNHRRWAIALVKTILYKSAAVK